MESQFTNIKELYFSFKGRISLSAFWLHGVLILPGLSFLISILYLGIWELIFNEITESLIVLRFIISIPIFIFFGIASLALIIKRCHDRDRSGWFVLIILVPIIGPFWYLAELYFSSGSKGANRYGSGPQRLDMNTFSKRFFLFNDFKTYKFPKNENLFRLFNILGLVLSISIFTVCLTYFISEITYDQFHKNYDHIFRIECDANFNGSSNFINTPYPMADALVAEFPQIINATRIMKVWGKVASKSKPRQFKEEQIYSVDSDFFKVFDLHFILGDMESALIDTNSIVITKEIATKYFENSDPRGEFLVIDDDKEFRITAVVEKFPKNSHFHFDFLVLLNPDKNLVNNWNSFLYYTYILIEKNNTPIQIETGFPDLIQKYLSTYGSNISFYLQPISDIHFFSKSRAELETPGNLSNVKLVMASGLLLFLFSCFNFVSLVSTRIKENTDESFEHKAQLITRKQKFKKLILEGFLGSLIALLVSIGLTRIIFLLVPSFIESGIESSFKQIVFLSTLVWVAFNVLVLFTGYIFLLAFSYHLGSTIIKGGLTILQTGVVILLVTTTIQVSRQVHYLKNKDLGFDVKDLVIIDMRASEINPDTLKKTLINNPDIISSTWISSPLPPSYSIHYSVDGIYENSLMMQTLIAEDEVLSTLGIELITGRGSSQGISTNKDREVVINETAARNIGIPQDAIGRHLINYSDQSDAYKIIGVMKDVNFESLHRITQPFVILISKPELKHFLLVKLRSDQTTSAISFIEETSNNLRINKPFAYSILKDKYNNLYHKEERLAKLLLFASLIFIITSCYSIFGLLAYLVYYQIRKKIISPYLLHLILTPSLVYYASVISWPVAYIVIERFLNTFAYRIELSDTPYILSALLLISISVLIALIIFIFYTYPKNKKR